MITEVTCVTRVIEVTLVMKVIRTTLKQLRKVFDRLDLFFVDDADVTVVTYVTVVTCVSVVT